MNDDVFLYSMLTDARDEIRSAVGYLRSGDGERAKAHRVRYEEKIRSFVERTGADSFEAALAAGLISALDSTVIDINRHLHDFNHLIKQTIGEISSQSEGRPAADLFQMAFERLMEEQDVEPDDIQDVSLNFDADSGKVALKVSVVKSISLTVSL